MFSVKSYFSNSIVLFIFLIFLTGCSVNGQQADLSAFLNNLSRTYTSLWKLITGFAYLAGAFFGLMAVFQFKVYAEQRTMMSLQTNIMKPLMHLLVCVALMWLPRTFSVLMVTTFGYPNATPMSYVNAQNVGVFGYQLALTPALLGLVRIVGLVSFVRGWMMMVHVAEQGHQASFGKAMTHIFGGLLLINIVGASNLLWRLMVAGS